MRELRGFVLEEKEGTVKLVNVVSEVVEFFVHHMRQSAQKNGENDAF